MRVKHKNKDMKLTNKERAKLTTLLIMEKINTPYKEEDYNHHLGYLISKYLSPVMGNLDTSGGAIPNLKRIITIKRRIVDMYQRAISESNDVQMKEIYTSLMMSTQKKIDKTLNKINQPLGNMEFSSYLY